MRINKWIAECSSLGRRTVDNLISQGKIYVNGKLATLGQDVTGNETITINGKPLLVSHSAPITLLLHKPRGYVCSRDGQGSKTIYDLLPEQYAQLKIAGRLDKDSSGLVILSTDGSVIQQLSHPTLHKKKTYSITTRKPLTKADLNQIQVRGVNIGDRKPSKFTITPEENKVNTYNAILYEGRNRQIRRTIEALHNQVETLHRTDIGIYSLEGIAEGKFKTVTEVKKQI